MPYPFGNGPRAAWRGPNPVQPSAPVRLGLPGVVPPLTTPMLPDDPDPFERFDLNPDITARIERFSRSTPGLPPDRAWREFDQNLRPLLGAFWDQQVRQNVLDDIEKEGAPKADVESLKLPKLYDQPAGALGAIPAGQGFNASVSKSRTVPLVETTGTRVNNAGTAMGPATRPAIVGSASAFPQAPGFEALAKLVAEEEAYQKKLEDFFAASKQRLPAFDGSEPLNPFQIWLKDEFDRLQGRNSKEFDIEHARRWRSALFDVIPVVGNYRSAEAALESYGGAFDALKKGDMAGFALNAGMGLLNTFGAASGNALFAKLVKKAGLSVMASTRTGRQFLAAHGLKKARQRADKDFPAMTKEGFFGDSYNALTQDQKKLIHGVFPNILGTSGERHARSQLRRAGHDVIDQGKETSTRIRVGNKVRSRRYDALVDRDARPSRTERWFMERYAKAFKRDTKKAAVEVKAQGGDFSAKAEIDAAVAKERKFAQEVLWLRYPVKDIPEKQFVQVTRDMLGNHVSGKRSTRLSQKDVDSLVDGLVQLRRRGDDWLTLDLVAGIAARAVATSITGDESTSGPSAPAR